MSIPVDFLELNTELKTNLSSIEPLFKGIVPSDDEIMFFLSMGGFRAALMKLHFFLIYGG